MNKILLGAVAVVGIFAAVSSADTVAYEMNFDTNAGTIASKVAAQMPGLRQATALNGTEGVLTCNAVMNGDAQLFATGSNKKMSMGLALPAGKKWSKVIIRLRHLSGNTTAASTKPMKFSGTGTSLVLYAGGKAKERGPMIPGKAQIQQQADGWVVVTYTISDIAAINVTNMRLDPIGTPAKIGKSFEIDYVKITTTP